MIRSRNDTWGMLLVCRGRKTSLRLSPFLYSVEVFTQKLNSLRGYYLTMLHKNILVSWEEIVSDVVNWTYMRDIFTICIYFPVVLVKIPSLQTVIFNDLFRTWRIEHVASLSQHRKTSAGFYYLCIYIYIFLQNSIRCKNWFVDKIEHVLAS